MMPFLGEDFYQYQGLTMSYDSDSERE